MKSGNNRSHPCGQCPMYGASVWQPVAGRTTATLARGFTRRELTNGEVLFDEGSENRGVYCVSRGLMALRSHRDDGSSTMLRLAYSGDVIGFRSLLGDGRHRTEASALVPTRVCMVTRPDAEAIIRTTPNVLERMAGRAIDELAIARERIVSTVGRSNKTRLAALLRELMERHGEAVDGGMQMDLPLSRLDLADLVGVQRETISRLIQKLEADGEFHFSRRRVWMREPTSRARATG